METLQIQPQHAHYMYSISAKLRPKLCCTSSKFRSLCSSSLNLNNTHAPATKKTVHKDSARAKVSDAQLKQNWIASLSCPLPHEPEDSGTQGDVPCQNAGLEWVIGIDPDLSGALALLKTDDAGCSAQVFDSPHLQVLVGRRVRRRLDAKSIVKLLRSFDAPIGTTAYVEQSIPFPQDGKQDDSRRVASTMFPSLSTLLKRKKDHGRAEALLIAAYGKGLKKKLDS